MDCGHTILLLLMSVALLYSDLVDSVSTPSGSWFQRDCRDVDSGYICYQSPEMYLSLRLINFTLQVNNKTTYIDTKQLGRMYNGSRGELARPSQSQLIFNHTFGNEEQFFNISMIFWMDTHLSNWSLVMMTHQSSIDQDLDDDGEDYYDYYYEEEELFTHTYPFWIGAPKSTAFRCDSLHMLSNNSNTELTLTDITMQAFNADAKKAPTNIVSCRTSTKDKDDHTALILGVTAGAAAVIAVVLITATYFYRHRKRGKYNLLD